MSFSGSWLSRCSSCATTRFATWSSIGVPRKMIRSFSSLRVDVELALAPRGALDDHRDQRHGPTLPLAPLPLFAYDWSAQTPNWPDVRVRPRTAVVSVPTTMHHTRVTAALTPPPCAHRPSRSRCSRALACAALGGGHDQPRRLARGPAPRDGQGPRRAQRTCSRARTACTTTCSAATATTRSTAATPAT